MGYPGKLADKTLAQELRKKGLSYGEILQRITVSKDTLSRWCRDIKLTQGQQERLLKNKNLGLKKGSLIAAENKQKARFLKTREIFNQSKKELGRLTKRDRFLSGVALYAAEGDKNDRKGAFTNSDPRLIKFMMRWFLEFPQIDIKRIRGAIWIHNNLDQEEAKRFWSKFTGIPKDQFHKTYVADLKTNSNKVRKNIHSYGIFSIRYSDSEKQRKILGRYASRKNTPETGVNESD